jgi:GT2 family glycosyltransferase
VGLIQALNQGWRMSRGAYCCFLHNDTEMLESRWLEKLMLACDRDGAGLAGLYGAKRLRRDGRYVGRTIVHSLDERPALNRERTEVAAVDGVCLFLPRTLLARLGGFDETYGFFHGYDRDLSFQVREAGLRCMVVNAPFRHRGGGTRESEEAQAQIGDDRSKRRAALHHFAEKWRHRLPSDVRPPRERLREWVQARLSRSAQRAVS